MDHADRALTVLLIDEDRDLDLRRRDHADVDTRAGQRLEHHGRNARVGRHACANDRNLGHLSVDRDILKVQVLLVLAQNLADFLGLILRDREGDGLASLLANRCLLYTSDAADEL